MASASLPDMATIKATRVSPPPAWALLERELIDLMNESAQAYVRKYAEPGGATLLAEDLDDLYEQFYNFGLFYALGADESLLDLHLQQWNATTRISDATFNHRMRHNDHSKVFTPSVHNEFWGATHMTEWHHFGEGNMPFYDFGLADPTISENVRRARRFAAMFIGEDPEAPNYDAAHGVLRSPFHSSQGPKLSATPEWAHTMLYGARELGGKVNYYGVRASLYPVVEELEEDWFEDPARKEEIVALFDKIIMNADTPNSLGATALVTNAYLYTGDEKYKRWVLDYTGAWLDRMRRNNGIMPDNVGPTGKIGEHREGNWWGGQYGWNCYSGYNIMFHALTIAAECALLLSGDFGYLEVVRSQVKLLVDNAMKRADGHLISPARYGADGWQYLQWNPTTGREESFRLQEMVHLYHASMSEDDRDLIAYIRDNDKERDWGDVGANGGEKNGGETELARFQYYDGKNPEWPARILSAEYAWALKTFQETQSDDRTTEEIISTNRMPSTPVLTKGLTQVTLGAPQSVYNGGLLRATVRYFDLDGGRPGLPADVAALVDSVASDSAGIQLVNLSRTNTRSLIVQAGAFGEHQFTGLEFDSDEEGPSGVSVDSRYFAVKLPPSTAVRVSAGMRRFANDPSYAFPWHGDRIPVPFQ